MAVVERPGGGKLARRVTAIYIVLVVATAGCQGQPRDYLALQLCVAAVDGRGIHQRVGSRIVEGRRVRRDRGALMLRAEYSLEVRRNFPGSLVLLAHVAADTVEGFRAGAALVGGRVRVVLPCLGVGVLECDPIGEAVIRRLQG